MSSFIVLEQVSTAIRKLLEEGFQTPDLTQTVKASGDAPSDADAGGANGPHVSWWLYEVSEDELTRNPPAAPGRTDKAKKVAPAPLTLNLYYLLTPFCGSTDSDLHALGKAMQLLNDNPVVLVKTGPDSAEELRISLLPLELEDRARIWEALRQNYRLSVCYQVRVVRIDSERVLGVSRVIEASAGVGTSPQPPQPE
jgi:hypothetical protein